MQGPRNYLKARLWAQSDVERHYYPGKGTALVGRQDDRQLHNALYDLNYCIDHSLFHLLVNMDGFILSVLDSVGVFRLATTTKDYW